MRRINVVQFFTNLLSLCVFPFAARPMIAPHLDSTMPISRSSSSSDERSCPVHQERTQAMKRITLTVVLATSPAFSAAIGADFVRLTSPADLRATALAQDPRAAQMELLAQQSALRLSDINADLRPALSFESQAQYQSDVASIPISLPGITIPNRRTTLMTHISMPISEFSTPA